MNLPMFFNSSCLHFFSKLPPKKISLKPWCNQRIQTFQEVLPSFARLAGGQWKLRWVLCFCHDLFPLPSAYHLFIVKVFPGEKKKNNSFFGEKNCFSWGLVPQLNLELTFFCNFWGHQRAMWQISTGFTSPQSCCNIHHHHLWPSNSHLKHHGSPHVHEGQIAKVHAEPGFQRNLWRNDTCRKETLILDRPTSGYHEGYHQKISCHTSALFARPEMFEPFQLPAFEKKNSATLRFPKKEKSSKVVNFWKTQSYGGNPFLVKLEIATSQCIPGTVCYITACFFKGFLSKLVNGSGL